MLLSSCAGPYLGTDGTSVSVGSTSRGRTRSPTKMPLRGRGFVVPKRWRDRGLLWGVDEALLGALAVGAVGAVGSTYNYSAPLYLKMMDAFAGGDLATARDCSLQSVRLVELLIKFGVLPSGKALMSFHGADCGPPRPPLSALSPDKKTELLAAVSDLGVITLPEPTTV